MRYTRHSKISTVLSLLILCIATATLLLFASIPGNSLFLSALQNTGHTILFAALAVVVMALASRSPYSTLLRNVLLVVLCLSLLGIAVELAQLLVKRDASWADVMLNTEGICIGVLLYCAKGKKTWLKAALYSSATILLVHSFKLPLTYGIATHFLPEKPGLADFEGLGALVNISEVEGTQLKLTDAPVTWKSNTSRVLKVDFVSGEYPGFQIMEPFRSWYGYQHFVFSIFNPLEKTLLVTVRVHDQHHNNDTNDRFNRTLEIAPGATRVSIPMDNIRYLGDQYSDHRQMDLRNIVGVIVFTNTPDTITRLYFDNFYLE